MGASSYQITFSESVESSVWSFLWVWWLLVRCTLNKRFIFLLVWSKQYIKCIPEFVMLSSDDITDFYAVLKPFYSDIEL